MKIFKQCPLNSFKSEPIYLFKNKNGYVKIEKYYGKMKHIVFSRYVYFEKNETYWQAKQKWSFKVPLSLYFIYVAYIYKHLGVCHKDLRSKYYIGKARENRLN